MNIHARIPAAGRPGNTRLYDDFVGPAGAPIHRWLPSFVRDDAAWKACLAAPASVAVAVVDQMRAYNESLGVCSSVCERLTGLGTGAVRTVVTGQQPGVMGGPLMSVYKAAAAVAVAARIEAVSGQACVPVFWLGADDDDFNEIRELSVLARDGSRVDVAVEAAAFRPGLRVGDIPATAVRSLWSAVAPVLPEGAFRDHMSAVADAAGDFADAAARA
ncbi:MAG TPA: bacillithiol biosynthesis BshC, partial [Candidatus Krumholzibacteria bacterium]|nr:bacillithiol biosynthesis BshC [Candidatus Krumholzibacteria bacterium]